MGVAGNVSYSVNGGRVEYNNWEIDGGDNMDNGSNDTLNVYPNVDAIAEVKVLTSNYGAQYGRNGSGTVETVTKSGTKDFHGDVFEFLRNDDFNARNYFSYTPPLVPEYKKNDFGGTIGGPVYIPHVYNTKKEKTFFFFSEEVRREIVPGGIFTGQVPSAQERLGNFSDVCPAASLASVVDTTDYPDCPVNPATGRTIRIIRFRSITTPRTCWRCCPPPTCPTITTAPRRLCPRIGTKSCSASIRTSATSSACSSALSTIPGAQTQPTPEPGATAHRSPPCRPTSWDPA